ncbi:hypothetical protein ACFJGW_04570 [Burkholderiaceae bacterium UC74_6]
MAFEGNALWAPVDSSDRLLFKDVEDGRLVFDRASCETRLLSPLSQFVVQQLELAGRPLCTADLVRAVQAEEAEASMQECLLAVEDALQALGEAQLIRTADA